MSAASSRTDIFGVPFEGRAWRQLPLAPSTWFRVGGPAEIQVSPGDTDQLSRLLAGLPPEIPVFVLGAGSNLIVRDGGIQGVVIRLDKLFGAIELDGDAIVAGGAASDALVARRAAEGGIGGLEFLAGIPGTVGGSVAMNAGAYGGEIAHVLDWADIVTRSGELIRLDNEAFAFRYRGSSLPPESVVVRARFRGTRSDTSRAMARISEIRAARENSQPVRERTGGSTFRNPGSELTSLKAWELIDLAGCRGLTIGGAKVSTLHTNFMINTGGATADNLETLGETVRARVQALSGIELMWEIKRVGHKVADL